MLETPRPATTIGGPTRRLGDRIFHLVLGILFVAMAVQLLLLVRQNRDLKQTIARLQQVAVEGEVVASLQEGDPVRPLELPSLDGDTVRVGYDDPGTITVLYVFSPDCPACRANMDNWRRLLESHASGPARFFYVSTAEAQATRAFAVEHGLPGPVLIADYESLAGYRLTHLPTTIVVEPGGTVKKTWVGALPEDATLPYNQR